MKRSKSAWGSLMVAALLVFFLWASLPSRSAGGRFGLHLQDGPPATQTTVVQPLARASNLILVEFFAGY
jgi:hypothetical protein